jgi:hypothetical protein
VGKVAAARAPHYLFQLICQRVIVESSLLDAGGGCIVAHPVDANPVCFHGNQDAPSVDREAQWEDRGRVDRRPDCAAPFFLWRRGDVGIMGRC